MKLALSQIGAFKEQQDLVLQLKVKRKVYANATENLYIYLSKAFSSIPKVKARMSNGVKPSSKTSRISLPNCGNKF